MPKKIVYLSSLSGKLMEDETDVVRLVVERHPALEDGQPVELELTASEADEVVKSALDVVQLRVHRGGGVEHVVLDIDEFNKMAAEGDMETILQEAEPAFIPASKPHPATRSTAATDKIDYSSIENCAKPHRGRTTDAEKKMVQDNFDTVNKRLRRDGMRTLDLSDPQTVDRYGLQQLAKERGITQERS